jgi:tetratricopeptide (TPR) repeat protein
MPMRTPAIPSILCLLGSFLPAAHAQSEAAVAQQIANGDNELAAGNYLRAKAIFHSAADQRGQIAGVTPSQLFEAFYRRLNAEVLTGEYGSASQLAQSLLTRMTLQPEEQSQVIFQQGWIAMERGEYTAAAGYFDRAMNGAGPTTGLVRAASAELLRRREQYPEALRAFEEAATMLRGQNRRVPREVRLGPAAAAFALGKYEDARNELTKLAGSWNLPAGHPDTVALRLLSAAIALQLGDLTKAGDDLKGSLQATETAAGVQNPLFAEALALNLRHALVAGDTAAAKGFSEAAVRYLSNSPGAAPLGRSQLYLSVAASQMFDGDFSGAQKNALEALRVRSALAGEDSLSAAEANVAVALCEIQLNRTNLAESNYLARAQAAFTSRQASPAQESRRSAELAMALIQYQRRDLAGAKPRINAWLSSSKGRREWGSALAREVLGEIYLAENQPGEAAKALKESLDLHGAGGAKPNPATVSRLSMLLARARIRMGDAAGVVSALEAVLGRDEFRNTLEPLQQAEAHRLLGESYTRLRLPAESARSYQTALKLMEGRIKPEQPQFLTVLEATAQAMMDAKRPAEAMPLFRRVLTLRDQKFDQMSPESITVVSRLADLYFEGGSLALAAPLYERLIDATVKGKTVADRKLLLERVAETYSRTGKRVQAAAAYDQRARLALDRHLYPEAEDFATRIQKVAGESADTAVFRAGALNILGDIRSAQNKPEDAEKLYKEAAALATGNAMIEAASLNGIGRLALKQKDFTRSRENLDKSLNLINGVTTSQGKRGLEAMITANLAAVKAVSGDTAGAVELYDKFLGLENGTTVDDAPLIEYLDEVANLYARVPAKSGEVGEIYRRRLTASTRSFGDTSQEAAYAHYNLAESLALKREFPQALREFQAAQRIFDAIKGPESDESITALTGLASTQTRAGQLDEALRSYATLLSIAEKSKDNSARKQTSILNSIAMLHRQAGRHAEARETFQRIAVLWAAQGAAEPLWVAAMRNVGTSLGDEGNAKEVPVHFATLRQGVRRAAANKDSLAEVEVVKAQAQALKKVGRTKESDDAQRQADAMEKRLAASRK